MIGILLITHGTFGESLVQNVSHILGARPALIGQLGVLPRDNPPALNNREPRTTDRMTTRERIPEASRSPPPSYKHFTIG